LTYNVTRIVILMGVAICIPIILGFVEHLFFVRRSHRVEHAYRGIFDVLSGSRLASYAIVLDAIALYSSRFGLGMMVKGVTSPIVFGFLIIVHFQLFILALIVERKFHLYKDEEFTYAVRPARVAFSIGLLALLTNGFIITLFVGIGDIL
jgi:hypothetical protein